MRDIEDFKSLIKPLAEIGNNPKFCDEIRVCANRVYRYIHDHSGLRMDEIITEYNAKSDHEKVNILREALSYVQPNRPNSYMCIAKAMGYEQAGDYWK
jgi:hypothetical protein